MRSNVTASTASSRPRPAGLVIHLSIEQTQPLAGTATTASGAPVHFSGWLAMLRAISDLVEASSERGTPTDEQPTAQPTGGHELS